MPRTISQKQIAEQLNVHVTLVSKVLNGRMGTSGVSDAMAERIRTTAREMGYRKNANAAALRSGRQQVIAAFIDRRIGAAGSGLIEDLIAGISDATGEFGQRQQISFFKSAQEFSDLARDLHPGAVDGLVMSCARPEGLAAELKRVQRLGIPVVSVYNGGVDPAVPNVEMNNARVIEVATTHLLQRGRRRVLHLSCSRPHEAGYHRALQQAGIPVDPALVRYDYREGQMNFTREQGEDAVRAALAEGVAFDAICAQSDTQAIGAMYALIREGRQIPRQVMITGVDDSPLAQQAFIPLTSVNQGFERRGRQAVALLSRLFSRQSIEPVVLEPRLSVRASTDPDAADLF